MKKNITINLYGNLYAIDEDAYDLLNNYLENLKRHFAQTEDGEEIVNDIECRIAELMQELKENGVQAVNIGHIKDIVAQVGNPEEMDYEPQTEPTGKAGDGPKGKEWFEKGAKEIKKRLQGKRLYRDPDNMVLGGVLSGLSAFSGIDVTLLRLLTVILTLIYGSGLIIYLICWLVIPAAQKPEDRLKMRGEKVNLENLTEEMIREPENKPKTTTSRNERYGCLNFLFRLVVVLMKWTFVCILSLFILLGCALLIAAVVITAFTLFSTEAAFGIEGSALNMMATGTTFWIALAVVVISTTATIWTSSYLIAQVISSGGKENKTGIIGALIGLTVAISMSLAGTVSLAWHYDNSMRSVSKERKESRNEHLILEQKKWLEENGWTVVKHEHIREDRYNRTGSHPSGNSSKRYIDASSEHPDMDYTLERSLKLSPGTYRLTATGRTNGNSAGFYAISSGKRYEAAIPNHGSKGGGIWEKAKKNLETATRESPQWNKWNKQAKVNKGKGFGWSEVVIEGIVVTDSTLRYGVSNRCMTDSIWNGTYICATDFKLEKTK